MIPNRRETGVGDWERERYAPRTLAAYTPFEEAYKHMSGRTSEITRVPSEIADQIAAYKEKHGCTQAEASRAVYSEGRKALEESTKLKAEIDGLSRKLAAVEKAKSQAREAKDEALREELRGLRKGLEQQERRLSQMIQAWNGFIEGWKEQQVYHRLDELEQKVGRLDQQKMNAIFR